jgi:hypothetical protein
VRRSRYWWAPNMGATRGITLFMAIGYGAVALGWLALAIVGDEGWYWFSALAFGVLAYFPLVHLLLNRPPKVSGRPFDWTKDGA